MAEEKAVVTKGQDLPTYLQVKDDELGTDTIDPNDIVIPRLKIVQSTTQVKQVANLKDGEFYNSLTNEPYGAQVSIFVLLYWKSRVWFTDDFKMRGTIYMDAATKEQIKFGNEIEFCESNWDKGIDAFNYMVVTDKELNNALKKGELPFPSIYSCMSASMKYARQLNGKLKADSLKKLPIYSHLITIKTQLEKFTKGQAFMPHFEYGRVANESEFKFLKELHNKCKTLQRRADVHAGDVNEGAPIETSGTHNNNDPLNKDDIPI